MKRHLARRAKALQVSLIRRFLVSAPAGCISLGLGQTNEPVPNYLAQAVGSAQSLHNAPYSANAGLLSLRTRIAARYDVDPERVIVTCGVQQALSLVFATLVDAGDVVLVPDPGFPAYTTGVGLFGGTTQPITLTADQQFRPTAKSLQHALDRCETPPALVVLGSPGNPTGAVATPSEWLAIAELLRDAQIPTLSDEIYLAFQHKHRHPSMLEHHPDAIIVDGLSKSQGIAGWRLGWAVVPAEIVDAATAVQQNLVTSASTLIQEAAIAAFTNEASGATHGLSQRFASRAQRAKSRLSDAGFVVHGGEGALYLWVRWPGAAGATGLELANALAHEAGVITIPGEAFAHPANTQTPQPYVRIALGLPDDQLDAALDRIIDWSGR